MTVRLSTGLVQAMASQQSLRTALANTVVDIYSGSQPATADEAITGTYLCTVSKSAGAFTAEVKGVGMFTIAGAASGSINTLTLAGIDLLNGVPVTCAYAGSNYNADAVTVAAAINASPTNNLVVASATGSSGIVTLTAVSGMGAKLNGLTIAGTVTTVTVTATNGLFGSGTSTNTVGVVAANGVTFSAAVAGVLPKNTLETWSGTAAAAGTAGCFRISGEATAQATRQGASATAIRLDGALATSGGDINLGSLTVSSGAPFILSTFSLTVPKV